MSDRGDSDSDTSYVPESEGEDESSDSELELSDSELWEDVDPVEDSGWQFLVDIC